MLGVVRPRGRVVHAGKYTPPPAYPSASRMGCTLTERTAKAIRRLLECDRQPARKCASVDTVPTETATTMRV
jgi:hypothetical protein